MTLGMFFPALSAMIFHAPPEGTFHHISPHTGTYHLESLLELRANPSVKLDLNDLPGLVTFPSFHTAMGLVGIYCARHSVGLLALSLAYNVPMIASTPSTARITGSTSSQARSSLAAVSQPSGMAGDGPDGAA